MNQDIYFVVEHLRGRLTEISPILLAAARALAQATGGRVVAVLLGHQAAELAAELAADQVLYIDHPALAEFTGEAYLRALAPLVKERQPRALLLGDTSIGADVAGALSARLGLPLLSACRSVTDSGGLVSQICGGKIMAEASLPDSTTLVSVAPGGYPPAEPPAVAPEVVQLEAPPLDGLRLSLRQYHEPAAGDVDIGREPVLIAVGRGLQQADNLELAQSLAEAVGGVVCASRPVVDQGWLPASRLVGKSGKSVKPRLYVTLGISGAPEHVEGIGASQVIIAVNTDPAAPIFNVARYGTTVDLFDLVPLLVENLQPVKAG